jgi:hypothetical protein
VLTLSTSDEADAAFAFYRERLTGPGWQTEAEMQLGAQRLLSARRGELLASVAVADDQEGGATIVLTIGKAQPDTVQ